MKKNKITLSLIAAGGLLLNTAVQAQHTPFNNNFVENDLQGNFEAMVTYAQNVTMPHNNYKGDKRPNLTAQRDILLMVQPVEDMTVASSGLKVIVRDANNQLLGQLDLNSPDQLPAHDGSNTDIVYADNMWSVTLPAKWINPGLGLEIINGDQSGLLVDLNVGAPNELIINTLDLGMLANPRDRFEFMKDTKHHEDYFQKIPVSKLIVNPYESIRLNEVMLPTGTLLTTLDPSFGQWHSGDMRQHIAKVLIAHGINNANYGINSSVAAESGHPYTTNQITAVAAVGRYSNGVVAHGGSGGNGMVTIDDTLGNEWSHEVGHNFGLGHYPGGTDGSTHRPATDINSAWGWDQFQQRFIANFMWNKRTGASQVCCSDGIGIPAFEGYQFNRDAMAGGEPTSPISKYTLHTPFVLKDIQDFMEKKAVFDPTSSTGFKKWDSNSKTMVEFEQAALVETKNFSTQSELNLIKDDVTGSKLLEFINSFDRTVVSTFDGSWIRDIYLPDAKDVKQGKSVSIARYSGYGITAHINGQTHNFTRNEEKHYVSNGNVWTEATQDELDGLLEARMPTDFGVPVTTLVGYYDPQQSLTSYLFPALHGAYGFVYQPTPADELNTNGCYVTVHNNNGQDHYQLSANRYSSNLMNKLHINIKQSDNPTKAEIICDSKVQSSLNISEPKQELAVSIIQSESIISTTPVVPDDNNAPVADAGSNQLATAGSTVTLSAANSTDADGDELTYQWAQLTGSSVVILSANSVATDVELPDSAKVETYTFMLTVSDGKESSVDTVTITAEANVIENSAPEVSLPASLSAESGSYIDIKATASDKEGDALTYQWNTSGLAYQKLAQNWIRVTLPEVTSDKNYPVSVTVTDSQGAATTSTTQVKVKAPVIENTCDVTDANAANHPAWSASQTYVGGNQVSYDGLVWKSKYWNRGEQPTDSAAWELMSDVTLPWSTQNAYSGGDVVTYNGSKYQAKWWTRGDRPDSSSVWTNLGAACQ